MMLTDDSTSVARQYSLTDPLKVRIQTHERYSERIVDLNLVSEQLMELNGPEDIADVGCGPGRFAQHLAGRGHRGTVIGVDQSAAMLVEASAVPQAGGAMIAWVRGSATGLPVAEDWADWVVARHMLYHVADKGAALAEFCRVARSSGRVLLSTNSERSMQHIHDTVDALAERFSLGRLERLGASFTMENALPLLTRHFAAIEVVTIRDALVIPEPEPVMQYIATLFPSWPAALDLRREMEQWVEAEVAHRFGQMGGLWRDEKLTVFYVCHPAAHHENDCVVVSREW
ncbi:MAG: class I SAM-dependent methyltransferase [Chloroflexi bacterium]|nr:class I SAM-dependent methyltransferase [Chloroflexota bacterium]